MTPSPFNLGSNKMPFNLPGGFNPKPERQPIKSSQKSKVFDDQNGKCHRCKKPLKLGHTQYHHIKFVSQGGKSKTNNLVALCANCHSELHKEEKANKADKTKRNNKKDNFLGFSI